jgi:hypothetical protein
VQVFNCACQSSSSQRGSPRELDRLVRKVDPSDIPLDSCIDMLPEAMGSSKFDESGEDEGWSDNATSEDEREFKRKWEEGKERAKKQQCEKAETRKREKGGKKKDGKRNAEDSGDKDCKKVKVK